MDKIKIAMDVSKAMANLNKYVTNNINSSKTNNSKPVESIDLDDISNNAEVNQTDISSNQVNVSDIANSYNIDTTDLEIYQASLEKELEFYQVMLEDTENELGILKEDAFAESGTNLSVIEDMCKDYENTITSEIYQLIEQYKISCPEEKLEKFGINQADVTSMSYAELFEILKEKDDDVKEKLASIEEYKKENLDKAISENTEFSTYDEYLKRIEELESQQVTLNSAIYKTEQLKKMAKYEFLVKEEDYQNFNYECQIDKSVIEEMRMQMGTQVSYSEYCSKTGDNISPLEFCIWVRDNYPDTTATAMDNETLLKTLISVADEDSDLIKTYNYLFEKEGIESANKYLEDIEDQINQLAGQKKAEEFLAGLEKDENGNYNYEDIMNHFKVTGKGLGDGAQSFFLGLAAWHQSSDVYSVEEYESLYILEALSGDKEFANFLDNNYEISMSVGNMLPSMAAGMLLTPASGAFLMGASAGGNSYHQALVNGASIRDAVFYGVLSGTSEATLEKYLGAIPGLSDIKVSSLKDLGKSVLKEGTEEWTQEYVDAALRGTVLGEQIEGDQLNGDALKSFIYGAIIGGIMNSPSAISGEVSNRTGSSNIESNITNTVNEDVSNLTSEVKDSISAINSSVIQESVSKSIAEKISKSIKSLNIPGLSAIKKITEGSKNMALSTSNAINTESIIDKVTSAGIDNIEFLESDIRALMASATEENDADIWDAKRVKDVFYKALKGKFKKSYIDSIVDDVNIIDANEWEEFVKKRGHSSDVRGFVDKNHNVYYPSNASMHTVIHELFHKFSELRNLTVKTSEGTKRIVSGILEFYPDGINNILSNECLTDYLASKHYDQKIYSYNYDDVGIRLWERIDNALYERYGENDILLDSYLNNDPDTIRSIFDRYVYDGAYTELSKRLGHFFGNSKISGLVSQFEKAINPMGIKERVHSIFNNTRSNEQHEKIDNNIKEEDSSNKKNEESGSFIFMNPRTSRYLDNLFNEMSENCGKENAIKYLEDYIKTGDKEELAAATFILFKKLDGLNTTDMKRYLLMKGYISEENYDRLLIGRRNSYNEGIEITEKLPNIDEGSEITAKLTSSIEHSINADAKVFQDKYDIANYFNDANQFLLNQLEIIANTTDNPEIKIAYANMSHESVRDIDYKDYLKYLSRKDKKTFKKLQILDKIGNSYTETEKDLIQAYTLVAGPAVTAYLRHAITNFKGGIFNGKKKSSINEYLFKSINYTGKFNELFKYINVDEYVQAMDNIIEKSEPLKDDILVYRGIDDLYLDGNRINTFNIGQRFNDQAFMSTSLIPKKIFSTRRISLEIEVPKGTKAAYLEKFTGIKNYNQQELLLGRNNEFEIISYPKIDQNTGQIKIRARLIPQEKSVVSSLNLEKIKSKNQSLSYYNNFVSKSSSLAQKQIDLYDVMNSFKEKGLLGRFESEVRYLKSNDIYNINIPEHNIDHVERVLFYSMYMGEELGLSIDQMNILIEAAKFHDSGRVNLQTDTNHAELSAIKAMKELENNYSEEELNKIAAVIEYHEASDTNADINRIFSKYNISNSDANDVYRIATILKDADALDRVRFPGNLNEKYLRNELATKLIKSSYQIQEIRGNKEMTDNMLEQKYTKEQLDNIVELKKLGVSDYLINFYNKYNTRNVYNIIRNIIENGGHNG